MKKFTPILGCILLFLITGCNSGSLTAQRFVILSFPTSQTNASVPLPASDPQVQEAMKIIDAAFTTNGIIRDENIPTSQNQAQGETATYGGYNFVLLVDHALIITYWGHGGQNPSPRIVETYSTLTNQLSNRFGSQRVIFKDNSDQIQTIQIIQTN